MGDLDVTCECKPDPVPASGAKHDVTLHNTGSDRCVGTHIVVSILAPVSGCSLSLSHGGLTGTRLPAIGVGTLPAGKTGAWDVNVKHRAGTTRYEAITTSVSFGRESENDPMDDEPDTPHTCLVKIDVAVT